MNVDFSVNAEIRNDKGKGASRRLRRQGRIPAVLYGAEKEAQSLTLDHDEILHHLEHEAFYSHILNIKLSGSDIRAVLRDVQRHPAKPKIMHVDFQRISDTQKIHMHVPLHFINEDIAPGVKIGGGLISHLMSNVDVVCLAKDLPEYLEVDLANLNVGESLHLSNINLPSGVEIPALAHGADHDLPVVSIHAKKGGEEVEEAAPVAPTTEGGGETPASS